MTKEVTIIGEDLCKCGHPRYQHDKYGCQINLYDSEEECNCENFTPCSPEVKE